MRKYQQNVVMHTCDSANGDSGGIIMSSSREIVGLHYAGLRRPDAMRNESSLCIGMNAVLDLITRYSIVLKKRYDDNHSQK